MQLNPRKPAKCHSRAFSLQELLVLVAAIACLAGLYSPRLSKIRERAWITIDLNNIGTILRGSALYNSDNDDHMAHPTWGGDLTGPDGWAYLTHTNHHPVPGTRLPWPPSCAGLDTDSIRYQEQLAFFRLGQVTRYLTEDKTAMCPKDVATRGSRDLRRLWLSRPVKVTSYGWNATIGGFVGPHAENLNGKTYKVSQFQPSDWQMWELDDGDGFYFNDAGINPEVAELISGRHTGAASWWKVRALRQRDLPGGGVVGTLGGSAQLVKWSHIYDLSHKKIPAPNELMNGPGYSP